MHILEFTHKQSYILGNQSYIHQSYTINFGLFCCLTSQSTAMVMSERSVHKTTLFLGKLDKAINQYFVDILSLLSDNKPS